MDVNEVSLSKLCFTHGVEDLNLIFAAERHMSNSYLVISNGKILGKHRTPQEFANEMRSMHWAGQISKFVSIFVNDKQCCVYIASDGGRVCRPLIIAGKGVLRSEVEKMKIPKCFRVTFKKMNDEACKGMDQSLRKLRKTSFFDTLKRASIRRKQYKVNNGQNHHKNEEKENVPIMDMESNQEVIRMIGEDPQYIELICPSFEHMKSTGNFDVKRFRMHLKGTTQDLIGLSNIATLGHMFFKK